jgi:hypothetical protein
VRWLSLAGFIALVPAALNAAPPASRAIFAPICSGDGASRSVPLGGGLPAKPLNGEPHGCLKACHADCSRKRPGRPA